MHRNPLPLTQTNKIIRKQNKKTPQCHLDLYL